MKATEQARCIPNIGARERKRRLWFGISAFLAAGLTLVLLLVAPAPRWWRLPLFLLFWPGAVGMFQAREQTCIALANRGLRNLDEGAESIRDTSELTQIHRQARKVVLESSLLAAALTAVAAAIPSRR